MQSVVVVRLAGGLRWYGAWFQEEDTSDLVCTAARGWLSERRHIWLPSGKTDAQLTKMFISQ